MLLLWNTYDDKPVSVRSLTNIYLSCTSTHPCQISAVSQSQANQRAGRAGRESAGMCYRLFTEDTFTHLDISSKPEVQRVGIAQVVLQLFVIGVANPLAFPFPSPPSTQSLQKSLKQLYRLGAISSEVRVLHVISIYTIG